MGGSESSSKTLGQGQAYRIIKVQMNSPLDGLVQPFFDFIISVSPNEPVKPKEQSRSPRQILDKLSSGSNEKKQLKPQKTILQQISQYQDITVTFKIISTKNRNVKNVQAIPNRKWNGSQDVIGIKVRKQRYDQAFDTYCPMSQISLNSPAKKAGIAQGQYLLGCQQYSYHSINELLDFFYDRYFDKQIENKFVNIAVYNLLKDKVRIVPLQLKRGWGGKGLLGCQFLQGYVYKFPANLQQRRHQLVQRQNNRLKSIKIRQQLQQCDGASKSLVQALKTHKVKKNKRDNLKDIHSLLTIAPPPVQQQHSHNNQRQNNDSQRISMLQAKVAYLEETIMSVRDYISKLSLEQQRQQMMQREQNKNQQVLLQQK